MGRVRATAEATEREEEEGEEEEEKDFDLCAASAVQMQNLLVYICRTAHYDLEWRPIAPRLNPLPTIYGRTPC